MGRLQIILSDDLEKRLRIEASQKGYKKGNISLIVTQALEKHLFGEIVTPPFPPTL